MPTMTTEDVIMTSREVADYLKISREMACDLMRDPTFPTLRVGLKAAYRVRRVDFEGWLATRVIHPDTQVTHVQEPTP